MYTAIFYLETFVQVKVDFWSNQFEKYLSKSKISPPASLALRAPRDIPSWTALPLAAYDCR
jgi:hypothetical protein